MTGYGVRMWYIAGHEIVLTGSYIDPSYWSAPFVLRCYGCPEIDNPYADTPIWWSGEDWDVTNHEYDFEEAIGAVIQHTGPVGVGNDGGVETALFMARMNRRIEPGLALLQDLSESSVAPE